MRNSRAQGVLGTLFAYEIRMLLRDTRTILIAVVAPLIIFPTYILVLNRVDSREQQALEEETYTYALMGNRAAWAGEIVRAAIAESETNPDSTRPPVTFELRRVADPEQALVDGDLHVVVQGLSPAEYDSVRAAEEAGRAETAQGEQTAEAEEDPSEEEDRVSVPALRILYRAQSDFSREAWLRLDDQVRDLRIARRDSVFRAAGFPIARTEVAQMDAESLTSAAKASGAFLGVALTPFLVLLMLSGGSIVAVDAISGEKERGTLETLLTTAASRTEIVRAKLLAVVVVGLAVAVINVLNLLVYLVLGLLDLPANFSVEVGPLGLLLLLAQFVPVAVLVASALLLLSGASKTYREFQVSFFPLVIAFAVPSLAAALPGMDLHSAIAAVPLAGVSIAVKEILTGEIDLPFQLLALVSTGGLAFWLTRLTEGTLSNEKLISGADLDEADLVGGAALFPRHVLGWFLGLWVVFFLVSLWFGQELGMRGQVVVNLVVIFFGGSIYMVRRYKLDVVETFSLKRVHPLAWFAVLLGTPSALLVGVAVAELVNTYVFPVPPELLQNFGQELIDPNLPLWQIVFFLTVMPGIFEELFFRGVLLHGLRKRLKRRWAVALSVGIIFGIFHVSLFRIAPTAWIGFVLTWVVILGGSIYPAMLWHTLNNAISVVPDRMGWLPEGFEPEGWWVIPAGVALAFSFWVLWKTGPGGEWNGEGDGDAGT